MSEITLRRYKGFSTTYGWGAGSGKALLIFPHWEASLFPYQMFPKYFSDFWVFVHDYPASLLSADVGLTLRNFAMFEDEVMDSIALISSSVDLFCFYGVSFGTVMATRIANQMAAGRRKVRLALNLSGASFPYAVWNGRATRKIRSSFERQGIDLQQLEDEWGFLSPLENLDYLRSEKVLAFLSLRDKVMGPPNVIRLAEELSGKHARALIYQNTRLGHKLGGFINLFRMNTLWQFLTS